MEYLPDLVPVISSSGLDLRSLLQIHHSASLDEGCYEETKLVQDTGSRLALVGRSRSLGRDSIHVRYP